MIKIKIGYKNKGIICYLHRKKKTVFKWNLIKIKEKVYSKIHLFSPINNILISMFN